MKKYIDIFLRICTDPKSTKKMIAQAYSDYIIITYNYGSSEISIANLTINKRYLKSWTDIKRIAWKLLIKELKGDI